MGITLSLACTGSRRCRSGIAYAYRVAIDLPFYCADRIAAGDTEETRRIKRDTYYCILAADDNALAGIIFLQHAESASGIK